MFKSLNDFKICCTLSRGAFGQALLVSSTSDYAEYVIKEVNLTKIREDNDGDPALAEKCVKMCIDEYEKSKGLNHQNIVRVYCAFAESRMDDSGKLCNFYYTVMEYCDGGDLDAAIRQARKEKTVFPESQIQTWTLHIARALKYLHQIDIVHRDIKPKNVFLTITRTAKLGDFGTAKSLAANASTRTDIPIATWQYASPEMCKDGTYTKESDIWSFGILVYELSNFKRPFAGVATLPALMGIIRKEPPTPFEHQHYSKDLQQFVLRMLEKEPHCRPSIDEIISSTYLKSRNHSVSRSESVDSGLNSSPPQTTGTVYTQSPTTGGGLPRHFDNAALLETAKRLVQAISQCDLPLTRLLLDTPVGRNLITNRQFWSSSSPSKHGDSLLHHAARLGRIDVVRVLVDEYAWPLDVRNARDSFPIHTAARCGNVDIVELFLKKQPDLLEAKGRNDRTLLLNALLCPNCLPIVGLLVFKYGANIEAREGKSKSMSVHLAATYGQLAVLELLLDQKPELKEAKDAENNTPLNSAICSPCSNKLDVVRFLLSKKGAAIENRGSQGRTALLQAAAIGDITVLKILIESGANIDAVDESVGQDQAITLAAGLGNLNVVKLLLELSPELIAAKNGKNDTALNRAAAGGRLEVVRFLLGALPAAKLKRTAILENSGEHNRTPLLQAAVMGNTEIVKLLIEKGANMEAKDNDGDNVIFLATYFGHAELLGYFLKKLGTRAVLRQTNKNDETVLAVAQQMNDQDIVQLLKAAGATH